MIIYKRQINVIYIMNCAINFTIIKRERKRKERNMKYNKFLQQRNRDTSVIYQ